MLAMVILFGVLILETIVVCFANIQLLAKLFKEFINALYKNEV